MDTAAPPQEKQSLEFVTEHELRQLFEKDDCTLEIKNRLPGFATDDPTIFRCPHCFHKMRVRPDGAKCMKCKRFWDLPQIVQAQYECNWIQTLNQLASEKNLILIPKPDKNGDFPDFQMANDFLSLIAGTAPLVFQTVGDHEAVKDKKELKRVIAGTFLEKANYLSYLNAEGGGIFVTVNTTANGGRKKNDVTRIRAVWVDLDGAPLEPVLRCNLQPHVVVESSSGKYHAYWRVDDVPVERFSVFQTALAKKFNGDPSVKDPSRVMRLPGFYHRKNPDNPFMTRILSAQDLQQLLTKEVA